MGDPIINTQVDAINTTLGNIKVDLAALRPSIRAIKDAIAETYITDTIENVPIASFSDGADEIPVRELQVAIEPVQSLNGQTSPYPAGGGKNKLGFKDATGVASGTNKSVTIANELVRVNASGSVASTSLVNTTAMPQVLLGGVLPAGTYTFSISSLATNKAGVVANSVKLVLSDGTSVLGGASFTLSAEATVLAIDYNSSITWANGDYVQFKAQIEAGSSPTAWQPYSNICPISGHTEAVVTRTGVNVWDEEWELGNIDASTGQNTSSSSRIRTKNYIPVKPNESYYFYNGSGATYAIRYYGQDKSFIGAETGKTASQAFTMASNVYYIRFVLVATTYGDNVSVNHPSTDHDYHAYAGQTYLTDWGINQWDEEWESGVYDNNGDKQPYATAIRSKNKIPIEPNTKYYFRCSSNPTYRVVFWNKSETLISSTAGHNCNEVFTSPANAYYMAFNLGTAYGTTYNNDISINYPSTDTSYHAYAGQTYPISLGQTVYGGTLNVTTGVLTIDKKYWHKTLSEANSTASVGTTIVRYGFLADNDISVDNREISVSNIAPYTADFNGEFTHFMINSLGTYIYVFVPIGVDASTDVAVVYPLATPTTVQLTAAEVETLFGQNNVWCSSGNIIKLTYRKAWEIALAEGE